VAPGHLALGRAKDGECRASAVEPILGDLIDSLQMKALTKVLAKMPAAMSETNYLNVNHVSPSLI